MKKEKKTEGYRYTKKNGKLFLESVVKSKSAKPKKEKMKLSAKEIKLLARVVDKEAASGDDITLKKGEVKSLQRIAIVLATATKVKLTYLVV